jgi:hypothetical protein
MVVEELLGIEPLQRPEHVRLPAIVGTDEDVEFLVRLIVTNSAPMLRKLLMPIWVSFMAADGLRRCLPSKAGFTKENSK